MMTAISNSEAGKSETGKSEAGKSEAAKSEAGRSETAKTGRRRLAAPIATDYQFVFVPDALRVQCRHLIMTFHDMHGFGCLPDMLWKAGLAAFIGRHGLMRDALQHASTARSARRANEFFTIIAVEILAVEILARDYAGWSEHFKMAKGAALELFGGSLSASRTWLIEHYLYPPRMDSPIGRLRFAPVMLGPGCAV